MPVIYHCGFNGLTMPFATDHPGLSTNAGSNPTGIQANNNLINNYFGTGDPAPNGGTNITFYRWVENAYSIGANSALSWMIAPAELNPQVPALTYTAHRAQVSEGVDTRQGMCFFWGRSLPAGVKSCVFGFRFWLNGTDYLSRYAIDLKMLGANGNDVTHIRAVPYVDLAGKDTYIEIVVRPAASNPVNDAIRDVEIFMDDVSVGVASSIGRFHGLLVATESYIPPSGTPYKQRTNFYQFRDMYLMSVESDTDVRIGSSATVVPVKLSGDDSVQFQRPDGYESNASVAEIPMKRGAGTALSRPTASDPSVVLVGDAAGQQDTYGLDVSKVADTLGSIDSVRIRSSAMNPLLGQRTFSTLAKSGSETAKTTVSIATGNQYQQSSVHLSSDPSDGQRWTLSKLAALKVGTRFES